ncbi:MAG: hypothetical protein LWX56_11195 [Ignavibacteria bacterium]|nr:hypothetical protein [Ignavibacteria bacterium]
MIEGAKSVPVKDIILAWIYTLLFTAAGVYFIATRGEFNYIDYFSLIIHEAGHFLLGWGGDTITALGGTIMQLLVPLLLIIFSLSNRMRKFLQFSLLLLAQNCINISTYAADAKDMKLKLFGGPGVKHDWNYILTKYDALGSCNEIATGFIVLACLAVFIIIISPFLISD